MILNELKKNWMDKKILILGFGREGQDTFLFLRKIFPEKTIGIADKSEFKKLSPKAKKIMYHISNGRKKCGTELHLGDGYLKSLKDYEIIIKSPGVPIHLPEIEKAFKQGKITSQTEIFLQNCPGIIVGVTGTKGKSTTASLIYEILKARPEQRRRVRLVGNIGNPVLGLLSSATKKDIYVFELSCHQLYKIKISPQVAVFLNVYPEHLDYYKNFKEYASAKANIALWQNKNDYLIYNSEDKIVREIAKKLKFLRKAQDEPKKIPIKGKYYELNKTAAEAVGKIFKIPAKSIKKTIKEFKGLEHRMELVGTFKGITFYNDALATIPEATMEAIDILGDRVETIMLGGFDRNIDFKKLAQKILQSKIKNVIFFPTTGKKIWQAIVRQSKTNRLNYFFVGFEKNKDYNGKNIMEKAVKLAYNHTAKGKICLLSTACSSFSIFKDYAEKGNLFKKYAIKYGKQQNFK